MVNCFLLSKWKAYHKMLIHNHYLVKNQSCHYIETSQLICRANQLTVFYMIATLSFNELSIYLSNLSYILSILISSKKFCPNLLIKILHCIKECSVAGSIKRKRSLIKSVEKWRVKDGTMWHACFLLVFCRILNLSPTFIIRCLFGKYVSNAFEKSITIAVTLFSLFSMFQSFCWITWFLRKADKDFDSWGS